MPKPELRDHRKFLKLKRLLNAPTPHVIGYLDCLWHRGYQTGNPFVGDALDVEAAAEFPGTAGEFAKAAHEAGFLDLDGNGNYLIHDLFEHAPNYAKKRMHRRGTAPAGTNYAGGAQAEIFPNGNENVKIVPEREHSGNENPDFVPARDTEPRAKSQEPKTENPKEEEDCSDPGVAGSEPDGLWGKKGSIRFDPETGEWHGITDRQRTVWRNAYPAVDIEADLAKAAAWCIANPSKGRKSNYPKFLTNWLSRTQDSGGTRGRAHGPSPPPDKMAAIRQIREQRERGLSGGN